MCEIIRYMKASSNVCTSEEMREPQVNSLSKYCKNSNKIDIANCKGEPYTNSSNIGERYEIMPIISALNSYEHFMPCSAHSLKPELGSRSIF